MGSLLLPGRTVDNKGLPRFNVADGLMPRQQAFTQV